MTRLPAGVVFDCDGTLVDTEPLSELAWHEVLGRRGYVPTAEDFAAVLGRHGARSLAHFGARVPLGDPDEFRAELGAAFDRHFEAGVRVFADAVGTIQELHAAGVPVAVASSSSRRHVLRSLAACGLADVIVAAVGADDVGDHKPHPRPYLLAAEVLGVAATDCTAVEDSEVGIAAASAAGMFTVAVRRGHVPDSGLTVADRVVDELTLEALVR